MWHAPSPTRNLTKRHPRQQRYRPKKKGTGVQCLKRLPNNGCFADLTRTEDDLNKTSWLGNSLFNQGKFFSCEHRRPQGLNLRSTTRHFARYNSQKCIFLKVFLLTEFVLNPRCDILSNPKAYGFGPRFPKRPVGRVFQVGVFAYLSEFGAS